MLKRILSTILAACMVLVLAASCSTAPTESTSDTPAAEGGDSTTTDTEEAPASEPLKQMIYASEQGRAEFDIRVAFAEENGFELETVVIPDMVAGETDKFLVSLMGGESFDLFMRPMANVTAYVNAGVLTPIDELAAATGYDLEGTYGDYIMSLNGVNYGVPAFVDVAMTLYNKKVFDDAGVPYPTAEDWTWEKFIEVGQQITDEDANIYGAYNPLWAHYTYMYAMQKEVPHFKEDGTSNYDDPVFAEGLEFYYNLGNVDGVSMPYLIQESKQLTPDYFTTGSVGMTVIGSWTTTWLSDSEKYPRDWQAGIVPMPYPEGEQPSTSTVVSGFYVPTTAAQPERAFELATLWAENYYTFGGSRIPARIDLTDEEIESYIETELIAPLEADGITVEDIKHAWFNPERRPFEEKVMSSAGADINAAFNAEGGLYAIGEQDLETTMANIKEIADEAIINTAS